MSCNVCQSKFSFFTRENGCPRCGFSCCSKCLKYKCKLSNDTVEKVCGPCYNKQMLNSQDNSKDSSNNESSSKEVNYAPIAPVDIEQKINSLDNPIKPPIVIYKQGHWDTFKSGLDPVDQAIVDRLKKLKDEDKQPPPPTTEEIYRRLALLKDQDPDHSHATPTNIHHVNKKSVQEQSEDLIRQYLEQLKLSSSSSNLTDDIETRLNVLRGIDPPKTSPIEEDEFDENAVTKRIIARTIAEASLEAKYTTGNYHDGLEEMEIEISDDSDEES